ncbi:MAG: integration host factor subunit alpha [Deltaproteobacteria bacterium]|nr:integration host factor subunit alpha [Deltaproteobacteria bacterium]
MTLTKDHLINSVSNHLSIPKIRSAALFETLIVTIKDALESGENVMISGFGKFSVQNKNERRVRNPATGEDLMLESRRVVRFKCSGRLRKRMNGD